jgi:hypothetical protein
VRVQALVRDPEHPVRRFSPMDEPTFALVASETIKAEEPFAIYTGTLWEEPQLLVRARGTLRSSAPPPLLTASRTAAQARTHSSGHQLQYAFDFPQPFLYEHGYRGPALVRPSAPPPSAPARVSRVAQIFDGFEHGTVARFINDWRYRPEGKRAVNCEAMPVWDPDRHLPAIVISATRDIDPGEELVLDYGRNFWRVVA